MRILALLSLLASSLAFALPPKIIHQTNGAVIVRMGADDRFVVWQEVGDKKTSASLYRYDSQEKKLTEKKAPKRPFGPSVDGGMLLYGAGNILKKVDIILENLLTGQSFRLHKMIPWISEPSVESLGNGKVRAVWERSLNIDGDDLSIYLYEGGVDGKGSYSTIVEGPIDLREQIPAEYWKLVHNEYPEISGESVAFQNNEYGYPQVYRYNLGTKKFAHLMPTQVHQERPAIDGPYVAWEESEKGYAVSNESDLYVHDARTGVARKVNAEKGFHYQARVKGQYVIYGAKRAPAEHTPSVRVYDLDASRELPAHECFTGSIFDWAANSRGVYAAQHVSGASSRVIFATWKQLAEGCK